MDSYTRIRILNLWFELWIFRAALSPDPNHQVRFKSQMVLSEKGDGSANLDGHIFNVLCSYKSHSPILSEYQILELLLKVPTSDYNR